MSFKSTKWTTALSTFAIVLLQLSNSAHAGVISQPGLLAINVAETSGVTLPHFFLPNSAAMTTQLATLSASSNDFVGAPTEFFDVFYSDAAGNFNLNGNYVTVEAVFSGQAGGGLNVAAVDLLFNSNPSQRADVLTSFLGMGTNYVSGSELLAVDPDSPVPSTFTVMGNTAGVPGRMHVTVTWSHLVVPEPASVVLGLFGVAIVGVCLPRRRQRRAMSVGAVSGRTLSFALVALIALSVQPAVAGPILNGGFETGLAYPSGPNIFVAGTPTPWTATSFTPDCYDNTGTDGWNLSGIPPYNNMFQTMIANSGNRFLGFAAGSTFNESFQQTTTPLTPGQKYTISAFLAADDGGRAAQFGGPYTGRGQVDVFLNSTFIGTLTKNTASLNWQPRSFTFTAPIASTAVFRFVAIADPLTHNPSYIGIDDIRLVPEPASIALVCFGALGLGGWRVRWRR